jgi:hypothetical protein
LNIRRGVLLGPVLHSEDDIAAIRFLFLSADLSTSRTIANPMLAKLGHGMLEAVAPVNLALQSHHTLIFDCQTEIFIWYGRSVDESQVLPWCLEKAKELAAGRVPHPYIMHFRVIITANLATLTPNRKALRWLDSYKHDSFQFTRIRSTSRRTPTQRWHSSLQHSTMR